MLSSLVLIFGSLMGFAPDTIPATFYGTAPEVVIGELRLRNGEAVELKATPGGGSSLTLEIRAHGETLKMFVPSTSGEGFERAADHEIPVLVRARMQRERDPSANTYATFTVEFEGLGHVTTAPKLVSQ